MAGYMYFEIHVRVERRWEVGVFGIRQINRSQVARPLSELKVLRSCDEDIRKKRMRLVGSIWEESQNVVGWDHRNVMRLGVDMLSGRVRNVSLH